MEAKQRFTLVIELGNDAMRNAQHVADALEKIAKDVRRCYETQDFNGSIRDLNGNKVGVWGID